MQLTQNYLFWFSWKESRVRAGRKIYNITYIFVPTHFLHSNRTYTRRNNINILYVLHYYCCVSRYLLLYIQYTLSEIPQGKSREVTCTRLLRPSIYIILLFAFRWWRLQSTRHAMLRLRLITITAHIIPNISHWSSVSVGLKTNIGQPTMLYDLVFLFVRLS